MAAASKTAAALSLLLLTACTSDDRGREVARPAPDRIAPTTTREVTIEGLTLAVPLDWHRVEPPPPMRKAEFTLPAASGDASLAVYSFGPEAGNVEQNLARWKKQMQQDPPDNASVATVEREGGKPITVLDVRGTYSPGMGNTTTAPGTRMMAAVVVGGGATWYFKLVGPIASVETWAEPYRAMLRSIRDAK